MWSGPIASWMTNILGWRLTTVIGENLVHDNPVDHDHVDDDVDHISC